MSFRGSLLWREEHYHPVPWTGIEPATLGLKVQAATTIVHQGLLARLPIHRAWPQVDSRVRPTRSALPLTRRIGLQELYGVSPRVQVSTGGAPRQVCVPQPVVSPHGIEPQNLVLHTSALPTKLRRQVAGLPIPLGRAPPINRAPRQEVVPRSPAFTGFIWSKSSLTDSSRTVCYWIYGVGMNCPAHRESYTVNSVDLAGIEPACKESPTCGFTP